MWNLQQTEEVVSLAGRGGTCREIQVQYPKQAKRITMTLVRVVPTSTPRISPGLQEEYDVNSKSYSSYNKLQLRKQTKSTRLPGRKEVWKGCAHEIPIFIQVLRVW